MACKARGEGQGYGLTQTQAKRLLLRLFLCESFQTLAQRLPVSARLGEEDPDTSGEAGIDVLHARGVHDDTGHGDLAWRHFDLHGQSVLEAVANAERFLRSQRKVRPGSVVQLITGRGRGGCSRGTRCLRCDLHARPDRQATAGPPLPDGTDPGAGGNPGGG